jgi:hypothetical protein
MLNNTLVLEQKFMKMPENFTANKKANGDFDNNDKKTKEKVNPNHVIITADGEEGTYSKWGLFLAVGVIFLLGFIVGALVCLAIH